MFVAACAAHPRGALGQVTVDLEPGSTITDVGLSLGSLNGALGFTGKQYEALPPDMDFQVALTAVPQLGLVLRHWLSRSLGLRFSATEGYLPDLTIPESMATDGSGAPVTLQLLTSRATLSFVYRHHFGGAVAAELSFGAERLGYRLLQELDPPVLVSTAYAGPRLSAGIHLPRVGPLAVTASGGLFAPVAVWEAPADSGRLDSAMALTFVLAVEYPLSEALSLELELRSTSVTANYAGHGDRGVSGNGVFDGHSEDRLSEGSLVLHYRL